MFIILLLALGAWFLSEYMSQKSKHLEKSNIRLLKQMIKEKLKLEKSLTKGKKQMIKLVEECEELREFQATVPSLIENHRNLRVTLLHNFESIDSLRTKLAAKDYSGNPVVHDALVILDEYLPIDKAEKTKSQLKLKVTYNQNS